MKRFKLLFLAVFCLSMGISPAMATIKVGTTYYFPPYVLSRGSGFDPEFLSMICERLNEKCESVPMDYYKLFTALTEGDIDIAMSGITFPVIGSSQYLYSLPYTQSSRAFMVLTNSGINSINQLKGKKVGILKEGLGPGVTLEYLIAHYPDQFKIVEFSHLEDLVDGLNQGAVSAAFTNETTIQYWILHGDGEFKFMGNPVAVGDGVGIIAAPKNAALLKKINQEIELLKTNKDYIRLHATYFPNQK